MNRLDVCEKNLLGAEVFNDPVCVGYRSIPGRDNGYERGRYCVVKAKSYCNSHVCVFLADDTPVKRTQTELGLFDEMRNLTRWHTEDMQAYTNSH